MRKFSFMALLVAVVVAASATVVLAAEAKVGCSACHVGKYTLAEEVKNVKGHVAVAADAGLNDCLKCHKTGKLALGPILHKAHFHEGENHFTSNKENGCQSCHVLNLADGTTSVKP